MPQTLAQKLEEIYEMAKKSTLKSDSVKLKSGGITSLHKLIRTKEDGEKFMSMLKEAKEKGTSTIFLPYYETPPRCKYYIDDK